MSNPLEKFYSIRDSLPPERHFSFGVFDYEMSANFTFNPDFTFTDVSYCEEMVELGKLDCFESCVDLKIEVHNRFKKIKFFYERGISIARRKVYIFRLPFFGMNVSVNPNKECEFHYNSIKIKKGNKEYLQQKGIEIVQQHFIFYACFIKKWITKDNTSYEECLNILKHYSENDGIITIPEFYENSFLSDLNVKAITSGSSKHIMMSLFGDKLVPKINCINSQLEQINCPRCQELNISSNNIILCVGCGQKFVK